MPELDSTRLVAAWALLNLLALGIYGLLVLADRRRARRDARRAGSAASLSSLIDQVERLERRPSDGPPPGSDAWWSAWAETGGRLPGAARSCRPEPPDRRRSPGNRTYGDGTRLDARPVTGMRNIG